MKRALFVTIVDLEIFHFSQRFLRFQFPVGRSQSPVPEVYRPGRHVREPLAVHFAGQASRLL
jgi:hypothetical protein